MKKWALLILLFLPSFCFAAPDTIQSTVCFQDALGNCLANGSITFQLSQPAMITSGGGQVAPAFVSVTLDATGKIPAGTTLWGNDQLTPSGTGYTVTIHNSAGTTIAGPFTWIVQGSSPIDLSQEQPSSAGVSYPNACTSSSCTGTFPGNPTFSGNITALAGQNNINAQILNNVGKVEKFSGATADVQINACLAAYQVCDARGYGATTQTIAATVAVGANQTLLCAPATTFQPGSASTVMFTFNAYSTIRGCTINATNVTYTGIAVTNAAAQVEGATVSDMQITESASAMGQCLVLNGTSGTAFVQTSHFDNIICTSGTAASGFLLETSGGGWVNGNTFNNVWAFKSQYGIQIAQAGTGAINGNHFIYNYEASSLSTSLAGVYIAATGGSGNFVAQNNFQMNVWDLVAGKYGVDVTSATGVIGNSFTGILINVQDSSSFVSDLYFDLGSGTYNGTSSIPPVNVDDASIRDKLTVSGAGISATAISLQSLLTSSTAPTISSGFGTTPSIVKSNGTAVFTVNVGTGGTATSGVIGLPTAANGWACGVTDQTTNAKTTFQSANTVSSVTVTATAAWTASDILLFRCDAF